MQKLPSCIAHIDADCFYVSCERVRDPSLIDRPVGVLGNQGACIIAKSYEMKAAGIRTGTPIWEAKKICPEGIYIKRDFPWYEAISKHIQEVLKRFTNHIEYYSIDESFLDFTNQEQRLGIKSYLELAQKIRDTIYKETSIPCTVGVASTRTLSKVLAKRNKPFGAADLALNEIKKFLKETNVEEVAGIARASKLKLNRRGIYNCLDYVNCSRQTIKKLLHKPGEEFWYELQGKYILPVRTERPTKKVVGRGGCVGKAISSKHVIQAFLVRNLERLTEALFKYRLETKRLNIILQKKDMRSMGSQIDMEYYSANFYDLLPYLKKALNNCHQKYTLYRATHVIAEKLRSTENKQLNLFYQTNPTHNKIDQAKRIVNSKHGRFRLRSASTLYIQDAYKDHHNDYDICDIEGKFCF